METERFVKIRPPFTLSTTVNGNSAIQKLGPFQSHQHNIFQLHANIFCVVKQNNESIIDFRKLYEVS